MAQLSTPVQITKDTTYVASYSTITYHADRFYFQSKGYSNPPLTALQSGVDGLNGVYNYGASGTFPTETAGWANYSADVVFELAINQAPSAAAQAVTTAEDTATPITLTGSDPDGDS